MSADLKRYAIIAVIFAAANGLTYTGLFANEIIWYGDFSTAMDTKELAATLERPSVNVLSKSFILSPLLLLGMLDISIPMHLAYFVYHVVLATVAAVSMFKLSEYVLSKTIKVPIRYGDIFFATASIFFVFSPFVIEEATHPSLKFGYYLAPLILFFVIKGVTEGKKSFLLYSAIVWSLAVGGMHWVIFGFMMIMGYIVYHAFYGIIIEGTDVRKAIKGLCLNAIVILSAFILINIYWIGPGLLLGGTSLYGNILTEEGLQLTFRNAEPINVLAMRGNFGMVEMYGSTPAALNNLWGINPPTMSIILTLAGIASLLFVNRLKYIGYFAILFIVAIFLSAGPKLTNELFSWFIFDSPVSSQFGWAFRTPKFTQILILSLSPLIALAGLKIFMYFYGKRLPVKQVSGTFVGSVLVFSLLPNYPILTGDFNGIFQSATLPEAYEKALEYLSTKDDDIKTVWGYPYLGTRSTWYPNPIGSLETNLSSLPLSTTDINHEVLFGGRLRYPSLVFSHDVTNIAKFFQPLNVGYIVLHNDIPWLQQSTERLSYMLSSQTDLEKVFDRDFIEIYEVKDPSALFSMKDMNIVIQGGLEKFNALASIETFEPGRIGVTYEAFANENDSWRYSDVVVMDHEPIMVPNGGIRIDLFGISNHHNPENYWSSSMVTSSTYRSWLSKYGIPIVYPREIGGTIFTTKAGELTNNISFNIESTSNYRVFMLHLISEKGGSVKLISDDKSIEISTKDEITRYVWTDLGTLFLEKGKHDLLLENVNGFNSLSKIVLVTENEYEEQVAHNRSLLEELALIHVLQPDLDMYNNIPRTTHYSESFPNGFVVPSTPEVKLWQDVNVLKGGTYNLAVQAKGRFNVTLDDQQFSFCSSGSKPVHFGPLNLSTGLHRIEIKPTEYSQRAGWSFTSSEEVEEWRQQSMEEPKIEYFLTSEDGTLKAELFESSPGWKSITSPLIPLQDTDANGFFIDFRVKARNSHEVHVKIAEFDKEEKRLGTYRISGLGAGDFDWKRIFAEYVPHNEAAENIRLLVLHGHSTTEKLPNEIWIDDVNIWNTENALESIWLFSAGDDDDVVIERLLLGERGSNKVLDYEEIDASHYKVSINASTPYMLSFAEKYNPGWVAEIDTTDHRMKYEPIKLYSVINGFWIDEPGNYTVNIKYEPKQFFNAFAGIAAMSLFSMVGSLVVTRIYCRMRNW